MVRVPNDWKPRLYQLPAYKYFQKGGKRALIVWHRRAGKDDIALNYTATAAFKRPGNYWHCLPQYSQAKKAIWEAVNPKTGHRRIDDAFPRELRSSTNEHEMFIRFTNGSTWRVVGSDDPDSLVGAPPVGIVFSEWALSNPAAWAYLAPILDENDGWAMFITTPRGRNHVHSMLAMARASPDWFAEVLTVADTGYSLERVEAQRAEYHSIFGIDAGDALIEQEYFCSFEAAVLGAYWGKELTAAEKAGRIGKLEYNPDLPVHTAWDLGVGDAMAIWWFQAAGPEIHVLKYYEAHGYAIQHYADLIKALPWQRGRDYVPQDAMVREMTSTGLDGKAKQRIEVMRQCGLKPKKVPPHKIQDGISAVRQVLPRCWFNAKECAEGLERLRQYRAEWDEDKRVFRDTPAHDWTSHGADAFRYLAMGWKEAAAHLPADSRIAVITPRGVKLLKPVEPRPMTFEELMARQKLKSSVRV